MIQCPYCNEDRPSRSRLAHHIQMAHGKDNAVSDLSARLARRVADVVTELPEPDAERGWKTMTLEEADRLLGPDDKPRVSGLQAGPPVSDEAAAGVQPSLGEHLARAGREIAGMRKTADAIQARLDSLDAAAPEPQAVRLATLDEVIDRLAEYGNYAAIRIVRELKAVSHEA